MNETGNIFKFNHFSYCTYTVSYFSDYLLFLKGTETTCVKIGTEMKKCSSLKKVLLGM